MNGSRGRSVGWVALVAVAVFAVMVATSIAVAEPETEVVKKRLVTVVKGLKVKQETNTGYKRSKFRHWIDADSDGCDTRREVLIEESIEDVDANEDCQLSGGKWKSIYDNVTTTVSGDFDIDHMVPLKEAWASGAKKWTADTRKRFANDLSAKPSLLAVTAKTNRSKGDREPSEWMPKKARCGYIKYWVVTKARWSLTVNKAERDYLSKKAKKCGNPKVSYSRAKVELASSASTTTTSSTTTSTTSTTVPPGYTPPACYIEGEDNCNCSDFDTHDYAQWFHNNYDPPDINQLDGSDGDGVVCESLPIAAGAGF